MKRSSGRDPSLYLELDRRQWRGLRESMPMVLTQQELDAVLARLTGHGALTDHLSRALVPSPPTERSGGGFIADGYDAGLDELRSVSGDARRAIAAMEAHTIACIECGEPNVEFGIALHMGEVIFGNIGAPDRLDFTVIGPAVNRVVRIEEMCRKLLANTVIENFTVEVIE